MRLFPESLPILARRREVPEKPHRPKHFILGDLSDDDMIYVEPFLGEYLLFLICGSVRHVGIIVKRSKLVKGKPGLVVQGCAASIGFFTPVCFAVPAFAVTSGTSKFIRRQQGIITFPVKRVVSPIVAVVGLGHRARSTKLAESPTRSGEPSYLPYELNMIFKRTDFVVLIVFIRIVA